jgi:hypothetical protein
LSLLRHSRHLDRFARRWRLRWHPVSLGALLTAALLVSLGGSVGASVGGSGAEAHTATPLESFGTPSPGQAPLALAGQRGSALAAGLSEGRQRTGQLVEPDAVSLTGSRTGRGAGVSVVAPRVPHLAIRGLLAVRAPPIATV